MTTDRPSNLRTPRPRRLRISSEAKATGFGMLVMLSATVAVWWRHLFAGYTFPWTFMGTSRWAVFVTNTVGSGHFSEWAPFVGGGLPIAQAPLHGLYSPAWWVLGALGVPPTISFLSWYQAAHVFLGAAGVFFLAREHKVAWRWALVAGTAFVFFGGFYGNASHDVVLRGHAYAPWLLWILTIPRDGGPWRRILALPLVIWVLATGAYAGQTIAFLQIGAIYLAVELWIARHRIKELAPFAIPAGVAAVAVLAALYLPYVMAIRAGEMFRPFPPTPEERAIWAFRPLDVLGLYLDPFAWQTVQGTITAWAIGVVAVMGFGGIRRRHLAQGVSLVAAGLSAFALAILPLWLPAGRIITRVAGMAPSRLPASDYKAMAAVALLCLAAMGWSSIAGGERPGLAPAVLGGLVLISLALAPQMTSIPPVRLPWLLVGIILACLILTYSARRFHPHLVLGILLLLTVAEGLRAVASMEMLPGVSPWALAGDFPHRELHDRQARRLRHDIDDPPQTRPPRVPEVSQQAPEGHPDDALGFLGTQYNQGDYAGSVTTARHLLKRRPEYYDLMLKPWTAWLWSCRELDCTQTQLPAPPVAELAGRESDRVTTTSYGLSSVRYRVSLSEPSLLVENEIPARGWTAGTGIHQVRIGGMLRAWALPAGEYTFTASYVQPERKAQIALAAAAVALSAASYLLYRRGRRLARPGPASRPGPDST